VAFDEGTKNEIKMIMKMLDGSFDPEKDTPKLYEIKPEDLKKLL
jgi:hypothetical protein